MKHWTKSEIISAIRSSELAEHHELIESLLLPSYGMDVPKTDEDRSERSFLGGIPHVPFGFEWPEWDSTTYVTKRSRYLPADKLLKNPSRPLSFIGQICLEDLPIWEDFPPLPLPREGILYFFSEEMLAPHGYEESVLGSWRVLYHPRQNDPLTPHPTPPLLTDLQTREELFPKCYLEFEPLWHIPEDIPEPLYSDLATRKAYRKLRRTLGCHPRDSILGYPREEGFGASKVNAESTLTLTHPDTFFLKDKEAYEMLVARSASWQLLFQIDFVDYDKHEDLEGFLKYMIRREDLEKRDFSKTWAGREE